MRGPVGCLTKLLLWGLVACCAVWAVTVGLNPWALHIGGRSTTLLYWHGAGRVVSKDGKSYPLYLSFWPDRPRRTYGGGRREGKRKNADLTGNAWVCVAPGRVERMRVSGTMYGGYTSTRDALIDFRLLEWRRPFTLSPPHRGFFDLAGQFHDSELVMDRPDEQGIPFLSGTFIDHATATLRWAEYIEFETACRRDGR